MRLGLVIENYMLHKKLEINFGKFQVITAPNGSGKSAIFHAVDWLINGGTNNFIRNGTKFCRVKLIYGNDKITREVVGKDYRVYKNGVEICITKEPLSELGISLPLEFFNQFDKLFLLSETPKNRADILNDMFDIESLELGHNKVKKDLKHEKDELKKTISNKDKCNSDLELINKHLNKVEKLNESYEFYKDRFMKMGVILDLAKTIKLIPIKIKLDIDVNIFDKLKSTINKSNKIIKVPDKILITVDYEKLGKLKSIINKSSSMVKLPSKVDYKINSSTLKKLTVLVERNKLIKNVPKGLTGEINYDILNKLRELRLKELNIVSNKSELDEKVLLNASLNLQLHDVECPICKNKL